MLRTLCVPKCRGSDRKLCASLNVIMCFFFLLRSFWIFDYKLSMKKATFFPLRFIFVLSSVNVSIVYVFDEAIFTPQKVHFTSHTEFADALMEGTSRSSIVKKQNKTKNNVVHVLCPSRGSHTSWRIESRKSDFKIKCGRSWMCFLLADSCRLFHIFK